MDEKEALDILAQKLELVQKLMPDLDRMGLQQKELYSVLDLDFKIDKTMQAKFEEQRDKLIDTQNPENNETTSDGDPNTDDGGEGTQDTTPANSPADNPEDTD